MIRRSTWILLGVFIAVLAVALYVQNANNDDTQEEAIITLGVDQFEAQPSLFDLPEGEVLVGLRVEAADGEMVELGWEDETNDWTLLQPASVEIDIEAVEFAIEQLDSILIETEMDPGIAPEALGLDTPAYQVILTFADGETQVVQIGNLTITEGSYYVQVDERSPQVASRYGLDQLIDWLANPPIPPPPTPELDPEATQEP
jgi:hypothetical protein